MTNVTIYATRQEAIEREIIEPIEANGTDIASALEFDIDLIAESILEYDSINGREGFRLAPDVDSDRFWQVVASCKVQPAYSDTAALAAANGRDAADYDVAAVLNSQLAYPVSGDDIARARNGAQPSAWAQLYAGNPAAAFTAGSVAR